MLGLKSFETAAITFAGIELANRIRKGQFFFGADIQRSTLSLKQLWDRALAPSLFLYRPLCEISAAPPRLHQNSRLKNRGDAEARDIKPLRYPRKISYGRGLYLLVMPSGSRYWRYNYRFNGKPNTVALGVHPDVSLERAKERHQAARSLLADGIDPSAQKRRLSSTSSPLAV
jgi:hypothetical protein